MSTKAISIKDWSARFNRLLKLDFEKELEQTREIIKDNNLYYLENQGLAILNLKLVKKSGNKPCIAKFESISMDKNLEDFGLIPTDTIGLSIGNSRQCFIEGYLLKINSFHLQVSLESNSDNLLLFKSYNIIRLYNKTTYNRMCEAMIDLYLESKSSYLIKCMFGHCSLKTPLRSLPPYDKEILKILKNDKKNNGEEIHWFIPSLNKSQKKSIRFALSQIHLAVIHGPPGTGKTTTLTELIIQMLCRGMKILCCAPSNIAVDNILSKVIEALKSFLPSNNFNLVRAGNRYRVSLHLHEYLMLDQHDLYLADVIFSTLCNAWSQGPIGLIKNDLDVVIIDECAQAVEPCSWIPLSYAKKCVLAGDQLQLPPTIHLQGLDKKELSISLMERIIKMYGKKVFRMLNIQYRMNRVIMQWPSSNFYQSQLVADVSVENRVLNIENSNSLHCLQLIDTKNCSMFEMPNLAKSQGNLHEARIVALYIALLSQIGIKLSDIGVITPYRFQMQLIESACRKTIAQWNRMNKVEINSIDGYQGREKEVIIISLVRSNLKRVIGFLNDTRRLNVAVTRARSHLCLICDSGTLSKGSKVWNSYIDYCRKNGSEVRANSFLKMFKQSKAIQKLFSNNNRTNGTAQSKNKTNELPKKIDDLNKCLVQLKIQ